MALAEILDIATRTVPTPTGDIETVLVVSFLTEATSGTHTIQIPEADFSPQVARQRAEDRAAEIDAAITGE